MKDTEKVEPVVNSGLYAMKEGELFYYTDAKNSYEVLRVPGGWIYIHLRSNGTGGNNITSCFVPFHIEFMGIIS